MSDALVTKPHVIVYGGGLAALACCLRLLQQGIAVTLVGPSPAHRWCCWDEGGLACSLHVNQAVANTLSHGGNRANPAAVRRMHERATVIVNELTELGLRFDHDGEGSVAARRKLYGAANRDAVHVADRTRLAIRRVLVRAIGRLRRAGATLEQRLTHHLAGLTIDPDGNRCTGVALLNRDNRRHEVVRADAVVLASEGPFSSQIPTGGLICNELALAVAMTAGARVAAFDSQNIWPRCFGIGNRVWGLSGALVEEGATLTPNRELLLTPIHQAEGFATTLDTMALLHGQTTKLDSIAIFSQNVGLLGGLELGYELRAGVPTARHHQTTIPALFAATYSGGLYHGARPVEGERTLAQLVAAQDTAVAVGEHLASTDTATVRRGAVGKSSNTETRWLAQDERDAAVPTTVVSNLHRDARRLVAKGLDDDAASSKTESAASWFGSEVLPNITEELAWATHCSFPSCDGCVALLDGRPAVACAHVSAAPPRHVSWLKPAPLPLGSRPSGQFGQLLVETPRNARLMRTLSACTHCNICIEVCPDRRSFVGAPAIIAALEDGITDSIAGWSPHGDRGIHACGGHENCSRACPEALPLQRVLALARKRVR